MTRAAVRACVVSGVVVAALVPGSRVQAQEGVLLYVPNQATTGHTFYTTGANGTLTNAGTVDTGSSAVWATMRGDQAYVYETNQTNNTVKVIDTATRTVVQTVSTGGGTNPSGMAFSLNGTKLYVALNASGTVGMYDVNAATGQLTASGTITGLGTRARTLALSPDGTRLYVSDQGNANNGSFRVVDTATNTVIATLSTGDQPIDMAISPDGRRAYVTNTAGIVRVIDTATATQVAVPAAGSNPFNVIVTRDGKFFYAANLNDNTVSQYSTTTNATLTPGTIASGFTPNGLQVSLDGKYLYVSNQGTDDSVRIFSIGADGQLTEIGNIASGGNDPTHIAVCSGGGSLLGSGGTFVAKTAGALGCATATTNGSLSFTGGTLMSGAAGLTFTNPATLGSGGGTFDTNGNTTTYSGAISGSGGLTKTGAGTLILTGTNSYTGGTTISQGTLQGNAASLPGNILNNAALVLDQTGTGTMTGVLTGTGTITKQGSGLLVLNGNSRAFAGTTTVTAGNLQIGDANNAGAALGGSVTVNSGATLSGHGSVVGSVTNQTGTVSPGGSIGTLTVTGNYVQGAAGTLSIELSATEASKLAVTGSAQLAGTLALVPVAGAGPGTRFQIVTAGGGITGAFTTITGAGLGGLVELVPSYSANAVDLQLQLVDLRPFVATENQRSGAAAITAASRTSAAASLLPALAAVGNLSTTAQVRSAVDALTGAAEGYTGLATATARNAETLSRTVGRQIFQTHSQSSEARAAMGGRAAAVQLASLDPVAQLAAGPGGEALSPWSAWASGFGVFGGVAGNGNSHDLSYSTGGTLFGTDYRLDPALLVGGFAGYGGSGTSTSGLSGSGTVNSYAAGAYASWSRGGSYVDGMLGYAYNNGELRRTVSFPGFPSTGVKGSTDSNQFLSFVEAGRSYALGAALTAVPFVNLNLTTFEQTGFTETGGGVGLQVDPRTTTTVGSVLGARLEHAIDLGEGRRLNAGVKLGWAHAISDSDRRVTARFAGAPGASPFTLEGAMPRGDAAVVGAGVDARLGPATSVYLHYDGTINGRDDAHALLGGVRVTW